MYNRYKRNGGVMKAGTELTRFASQVITRQGDGISRVDVTLDPDFIDQIDFEKTNFSVDTFFHATRVKNEQGVTNTAYEVLHGYEFESTTVTTNSRLNPLSNVSDSIKDLEGKVKKNADEIKRVEDETTDAFTKVIKDVLKNATAINNLSVRVMKVEENDKAQDTKIANHYEAIKNILAKLSLSVQPEQPAQPTQPLTTMVIYTSSVKTEADARAFVTKAGATEIKSVEKNEEGRFVVKYIEGGAIKAAPEVKPEQPKAEAPKSTLAEAPKAPEKGSVSTIVFYSVKSEEGVRKALEAQGVKAEDVISVELVDGRYVAKIKE